MDPAKRRAFKSRLALLPLLMMQMVVAAPRNMNASEGTRGNIVGRDDGPVTRHRRIRRNKPCPCGSGKKGKRCHGGVDRAAELKKQPLPYGVIAE